MLTPCTANVSQTFHVVIGGIVEAQQGIQQPYSYHEEYVGSKLFAYAWCFHVGECKQHPYGRLGDVFARVHIVPGVETQLVAENDPKSGVRGL